MASTSSPATTHRFDGIPVAAPDAILGLTDAFKTDARDQKMNLSVGVYQDATGTTPVLKCVKEAEKRLLETETSKGYLSIDGLPDYRDAARRLVFGDSIDAARVAVVQTPGGTGACRVAADFLHEQCSPTRVFLPNPTWANHNAIMASAGLAVETYGYLAADRKTLDFDAMIGDLQSKTRPGDAVLLHACCHNPTGVDPTPAQWEQIGGVLAEKNLIPMLDFAYQGFGEGLAEDAAGIHAVLRHVEEAIVCSSYSKNFGLYSERVGAMMLVAGSAETRDAALSQLKRIVRSNYSNPPRHGGSIVATVLGDQSLTSLWHEELADMRTRIAALRKAFVDGMAATGVDQDFSFLLDQKGMFSFSGLTPMQVDELRTEHGVYLVGSGRINVAGMNESKMQWLCGAVAAVLR